MASITIKNSHKNLLFAACVANQTGASFEESGEWLIISDQPTLTIPHYCTRDAGWDPAAPANNSAWRSLLLNKSGHLIHFDDSEIVISDEKPQEKRPGYLLRFDSQAQKDLAEQWAGQLGYSDLREYILAAIEALNRSWEEKRIKKGE